MRREKEGGRREEYVNRCCTLYTVHVACLDFTHVVSMSVLSQLCSLVSSFPPPPSSPSLNLSPPLPPSSPSLQVNREYVLECFVFNNPVIREDIVYKFEPYGQDQVRECPLLLLLSLSPALLLPPLLPSFSGVWSNQRFGS